MEEGNHKSEKTQLEMLAYESKDVDDKLTQIEDRIFELETQYLQDNCPTWNIIKGFDGFNERSQTTVRRTNITRDDRIFSLSSYNSPAVSIPMDDDLRSITSNDSMPIHKLKRNRKKKSIYGEDEFE